MEILQSAMLAAIAPVAVIAVILLIGALNGLSRNAMEEESKIDE